MARGRMISQSVAEDIEFNSMGCEARLLFLMTIPHLDRDGLINAHPTIMLGKVAPLVMLDMLPKLSTVIQEWVIAGLVIAYSDGKVSVLFFTGFAKNQAGRHYEREAPSVFAPPPGYERTSAGLVVIQPKDDDNTPPFYNPNGTPPPSPHECKVIADELRTSSGLDPDEVQTNSETNPLARAVVEVEVKSEVDGGDSKTSAREAVTAHRSKPPPPPTTDSHKYIDPRKVVGQFVQAGKGDKPYEVFREIFPWTPNLSQIQHMHQHVTDLAHWRLILNECAARGFKTYQNMFKVYTEGFREDKPPPGQHVAVSSGRVELSIAGML